MSKNINTQVENNFSYKPPIITVMGHVDHGKTTLLDYIRKTRVADKEFGGITQSIGGYQTEYEGKKITFIDTPGHEAFSAMRERGANLTDIIVLVVAADDGIKDQTREVINIWKKSGTQLIVAINKIDVPGANPEKVKREIVSEGVPLEGWGGDVPVVEVSAKTGQNVEVLLETIDLVSEVHGLNKIPVIEEKVEYLSEVIVLESNLHKSMGAIANVIVKYGTLKQGDFVSAAGISGKVRALINEENKTIAEATISMPVAVVGIPTVLNVGEIIRSYPSEKLARENSVQSFNDTKIEEQKEFTEDMLASLFGDGEEVEENKELKIILKGDKMGSLEAIETSLKNIEIPSVDLKVISSSTGLISRNDIDKAALMKAIIIIFGQEVASDMVLYAKQNHVLIRIYKVIYELIDELEEAMIGLVEPQEQEIITGIAEVRALFVLSDKSVIAGSLITKDKIQKGYKCYVERKGERVFEGKVTSLRHNKDEVKEVIVGNECGIGLDPKFEIQTGDRIYAYRIEKV